MKILVFGAGVLGCNLARNFFQAGKDVTLLARGNWAEEIKKNGLRIKNQILPYTTKSRIAIVTELKAEDEYDVIFVAVRYTQIETITEVLRANITRNIVLVGNNVRAEEVVASLPEKNVLFAFSSSADRREKDKVVSVDLKKITIGQILNGKSNEKFISQIFDGTKYKVAYEPNMGDFLLCHASFVIPAVFACYKTDGNLKKLKGNVSYVNKIIDANIEAYRAIKNAGHEILPNEDKDFESDAYRKNMLRFFKIAFATKVGKICISDHAMNAIGEMNALNRDLKGFFDKQCAEYPVWRELEKDCESYLK